jgi:solute carrier family 25 carnitine/acylcarnitine transporter 20/29
MPDDYPSSSALDVQTVVSDALNREHEAAVIARARAVANASVGEESAYAVVAELEQSFRAIAADVRSARERARTTTVEEDYHAVVRIDHMNDSAGYVKTLRKWCEGDGVGARALHKPATASGRIEGVFIALSGPNDGIKSFLQRLRTELVDVDSKGVRCRERKATTLCHRKQSTVKAGERAVESFHGFEMIPYDTEQQLEDALATLNLLHVGDGASRFV